MPVVFHYGDVIMSALASQITGVSIVCSADYSGEDQRKHHRSASLAFVMGIRPLPINSPHKGPIRRKIFPFDDVIIGVLISEYRRSDYLHIVSSFQSIQNVVCNNWRWNFEYAQKPLSVQKCVRVHSINRDTHADNAKIALASGSCRLV